MRKFIIFSAITALSIVSTVVTALESNSAGYLFNKTLRLLPGQGALCEAALGTTSFHAKFVVRDLQYGFGTVKLSNPSLENPPINSYLSQDGDSDRHGFTAYYNPPLSIQLNNKRVLLKAIILNVCADKKAQAGLIITLPHTIQPQNKGCLVTTQTWNYCR